MQTRNESLDRIADFILDKDNIAVFPHVGADGDCIGAGGALCLALEKLGKNAYAFIDDPLVNRYDFIPGTDRFRIFKDEDPVSFLKKVYPDANEINGVFVDCSAPERIGGTVPLLNEMKGMAVIDHHMSETCSVKNCCIDPEASSTGELIFDFIKILEKKSGIDILDREIATAISAAIYFDTGGLRFSNTGPKDFAILEELFRRYKPDLREISYNLFERTPFSRLCIESKAFSSIYLHEGGKIAISVLTSEMISDCGASDDDMDRICTAIKNIEGVEVAFLMREKSADEIRVNIRSSEFFDASEFALSNGGGGHKRAAGFTLKDIPLERAHAMIAESAASVLNIVQED